MRKSSVGLMLLPIVGLAAYGASTQAPQVHHEPGLYFEELKLIPRSARDMSLGYDGVARVTLNYAGPKPKWWGESFNAMSLIDPLENKPVGASGRLLIGIGGAIVTGSGSARREVGSHLDNSIRMKCPVWEKPGFWRPGHYVTECRYKLDGAAKTARAPRLALAVGVGTQPIRHRAIAAPKADAREERLVSHVTYARIGNIKVARLTPARAAGSGECLVTAEAHYTGDDPAARWQQSEDFVVVDSRGKRWTHQELNRGMGLSVSQGIPEAKPDSPYYLAWTFSTRRLPPGRAVFHSGIGIDDGWVEPVTVVLRTGKERPVDPRPTSLRIIGIQTRPAGAALQRDGFDTTTTVFFNTAGRLPKAPGWIYDYSQRLVAGGNDVWVVWTANGNGLEIKPTKPQWNAARKCWQVTYSYRLAALGKGRVLLRADLGLPREKMVPVECVARR